MEQLLLASGHRRAIDATSADLLIVNTCGFIESAKQESIDTLLQLGEAKRADQKLIATGCLVDEGDTEGNIRRHTRRLWPQTEMAKAWIAQAEAGEPGAADQARNALVRLDRHYLRHPVPGGWYDQFDRDHRSLVDTIPASSFYHILCAVAEAERVLR